MTLLVVLSCRWYNVYVPVCLSGTTSMCESACGIVSKCLESVGGTTSMCWRLLHFCKCLCVWASVCVCGTKCVYAHKRVHFICFCHQIFADQQNEKFMLTPKQIALRIMFAVICNRADFCNSCRFLVEPGGCAVYISNSMQLSFAHLCSRLIHQKDLNQNQQYQQQLL